MPYTPQTGLGATLIIGVTAAEVVDMSCAFEREAIDTSLLSDFYKTFTAGRLSGRVSATLAVAGNAVNSIALGFQTQSASGVPVTVTYTDASTNNSYTGAAYIVSATHTSTGTDRDTLQVELQFSGQIT